MLKEGQLVLYKNKPALALSSGDKAEIRLPDASTVKVREKDVILLHGGPLKSFSAATAAAEAGQGDFETARLMLEGQPAGFAEIADLVFGKSSPGAVWAVVENALSDSGFFALEGERLRPLSDAEMAEREKKRSEREGAEQAKRDFIARALAALKGSGPAFAEGDARFLQEIEARAVGSCAVSKVLKELKLEDSPESAHAFLLKAGLKPKEWNPHPMRLGLSLKAPSIVIPKPGLEGRVDLTGLEALAIDNAWSHDPDDAIGFEDGRLWVHVADPSSGIGPGSEADVEARSRAATLYLPDGAVPMLPDQALEYYGLGLAETSPALSFRLSLDGEGGIEDVEVMRSVTRVRRFSYQGADAAMDRTKLPELLKLAERNREKRRRNEAVEIELPEIHLWVEGGVPSIEPSPESVSSFIVRECMLLAGEGAARYAFREGIPFPFYGQDAPGEGRAEEGLAGEWAKRRLMRPGMISGSPVAHRGLGLSLYTQVTSPLRRYQDLLAHQQLCAHMEKRELIGQDDIVEKTGEAQAAASHVRQAERAAYTHWKLVWLMNRPDWVGEGVVVGDMGKRMVVMIPALAMETAVPADSGLRLNSAVRLSCAGIDLARLEARFSIA
jgi:exoribonuclease-2